MGLTESLRDTLGCFQWGGTPLTTTEVAQRLDTGRRSTYDRLQRLVEEGRLETKKVGASARVWWQPRQQTELASVVADVLDDADVGVFVLDTEFEVVWLNAACARYFGLSRESVIGSDKYRLIDASIASKLDDPERFADTVLATYEDNTYTERFECHVTATPEREERWLEHRSKPIETGSLAGGRVELYYDITERKRAERARARHSDQLKALNDLHAVVREITDAVISQSTREEIERTVCERLTDSESYLFAWIGDVDPASERLQLRTEAGVEGYLDGTTIPLDQPDEPASRAIRTSEVQTTDGTGATCCDGRCEQYSCRSAEAIPISHEGTRYGVLNVYTERSDAFREQEQRVINQLGEIVGHAIAATERKQALMSDDVVELQFWVPDIFDSELPGRITLDHAVALGDEDFLVYGTATADATDSLSRLVETVPHWESVDVSAGAGESHFELGLSEPPIRSVVASAGGTVTDVTIEDGDCRLTITVPPRVAVRRITTVVEKTYPSARLCKRRQRSRHEEPGDGQRVRTTELTDQQQASLEAAYHAGFFEWPREATGEEIAESMDIAPPTFHHHLREAHRKVFAQLCQG